MGRSCDQDGLQGFPQQQEMETPSYPPSTAMRRLYHRGAPYPEMLMRSKSLHTRGGGRSRKADRGVTDKTKGVRLRF